MYGAFAGYNFQRGKVVFGGEVSYTMGTAALETFPTYEYTGIIDVNGRVGFAAGRALIYVTAGGSFGGWVNDTQGTFASTGFNYGGGVDFMLTERIFLGVEYLVREMSGSFEPTFPGQSFSNSNESIRVRAGLNF